MKYLKMKHKIKKKNSKRKTMYKGVAYSKSNIYEQTRDTRSS